MRCLGPELEHRVLPSILRRGTESLFMRSPMARVIGLAVLISILLVHVVYAQVTSAHMSDTPGGLLTSPGMIAPTPQVTSAHMSDTPGGAEMTQFASGTSVVYLVIEYSDMQNEKITVMVYDNVGTVIFETIRTYTGAKTDSIEIAMPGRGAFPDGRYVTNLYSGLFPFKTIIWEVNPYAGMATPTPTAPTATATAVPPTSTSTPVPPTSTPVPPTATPTPPPPTPTLEPGQPTPTPMRPTPTRTPEQPYPAQPTPIPPTSTLAPEQPTLAPEQPTFTPTPTLPVVTATEAPLTPMLTAVTEASPTPPSATILPTAAPMPTTTEAMPPSPTSTTVLPAPTTALTAKLTPVPTVGIQTTQGSKSLLVIAGYGGAGVALVLLALFLWQRRSP